MAWTLTWQFKFIYRCCAGYIRITSPAYLQFDLTTPMSSPCFIPSNPDISGIGVRVAIYLQNLLCFIPAIWAIWDGKVSDYELESAETQSTNNLVLAFAILISCIVQALTLGLTTYHATIVLSLSWMNNTNAFIYFLLYVQYKGQEGLGHVEPQWCAWVRHIKSQVRSVLYLTTGEYNRHYAEPPLLID